MDSHPVKYNGAGNFRFVRTAAPASTSAVVGFDGADDGLLAPATSNLPREATVYAAFERQSNGAVLQDFSSGWWFIRNDGAYSDGWVVNRTVPTLETHLAALDFGNGGTRFYLNGEDWTQDPSRTSPAPGRLALGGGVGHSFNPARAEIAEVLIFDRSLDAVERYQVEAYLADRHRSQPPQVPPVAVLPSGDFGTGDVTVTLALGIPGAEIRYTTDGSEPDAGATLYAGPFVVARDTEVRARGFVGGAGGAVSAEFYGLEGGGEDLPVAGASMWLRADRGLELDSEGAVRRWRDLTGNDRDVVQGIAAKRPRFESAGLGATRADAIIVQNVDGRSAWGGSLGEDFVVEESLDVTHLGAFDHRRDGFSQTITVQLWSRDDGGTTETQSDDGPGVLLAERTFTPGDPGEPSGALRFKALDAPLTLAPGAYTVFAWGYTGEDEYYEGSVSVANDDPRFRFIGSSRFSGSGNGGDWPGSLDNRRLDYNGAANFRFVPASGDAPASGGVVFDGADDGLRAVEEVDFGRPSTVVVAYEFEREENGYVIQNDSGTHWYINQARFYAGGTVQDLDSGVRIPRVASMINAGDTTRAFLDGVEMTGSAGLTGGAPGRLALGGGEGRSNDPLPVRIAEVVVFDRALDAAELDLVHVHFATRHGVFAAAAARPEIAPLSNYGDGDVQVTLATATPGAEIRYTTDGSAPDAGATLYAGSFSVPRGTRVRAVARLPGREPSPVAEAFYGDASAHPLPVTDPALWVRADTGLELDSEGRVRRWRDLSGHGRDFVQPLAGKVPVPAPGAFSGAVLPAVRVPLAESASTTFDGFLGTDFIVEEAVEITDLGAFDHLGDNRYLKVANFRFRRVGDTAEPSDAVRFDGSNDGMIGPGDFEVGRPATVLMVYQQLGGTHGRLLQSGDSGNWLLGPHSNPQGHYAEGWVTRQSLRRDTPSLSVAVQATDFSRYFYNGEDLTEDPNPTGALRRVAIGGGEGVFNQPTNADLVELVIYDRVLAPTELRLAQADLAARHALPEPPLASPAGGLFRTGQTVTLTPPVPGAEIRYTLDGSEPDAGATFYTGPFVVGADTVVRARASADGFGPGAVGEFAFFIDGGAPTVPDRAALQLWLRAGVGTGDGSAVGLWRDLSGKGRDAVQTNADQQPALDPAVVGGAPGVVFDGADDFLRAPDGFADFTGGLTAIFVARPDQVGRWQRFIDFARGANSHNLFFGRSATSEDFIYDVRGDGNGSLVAAETMLPLSNSIYTVVHTPEGLARIYHNGSLVAEQSGFPLPSNIHRTSNLIGESNWGQDDAFSGAISEILLYDTALGDLERESLEQEIRDRYGIVSTSAGTVAFSPDPSQLYPDGVEVTLQSVTPGAGIRYTLDGSVPDESSALFDGPIALSGSARIRARAFAEGFNASPLSEATYLIGQPPSSGDGLLATYYDNDDFTGPSLTRVDPNIDFDFGFGSPDPAIGNDNWSARWTGRIMPRFSEDHTFFTFQDDGMRVWIDLDQSGTFEDETELLLADFNGGGRREVVSDPVALVAGDELFVAVAAVPEPGVPMLTALAALSLLTLRKRPNAQAPMPNFTRLKVEFQMLRKIRMVDPPFQIPDD